MNWKAFFGFLFYFLFCFGLVCGLGSLEIFGVWRSIWCLRFVFLWAPMCVFRLAQIVEWAWSGLFGSTRFNLGKTTTTCFTYYYTSIFYDNYFLTKKPNTFWLKKTINKKKEVKKNERFWLGIGHTVWKRLVDYRSLALRASFWLLICDKLCWKCWVFIWYLCTLFLISQVKKEIDARGMGNQPQLLETCKDNLAKETCQPKQEYTLLKEWLSELKQMEGKRSTLSHIEVDFANFAHVVFIK